MTPSAENGALGSVLELERALETTRTAAVDAEARLEQARREAEAILADARDRAEQRTLERRTSLAVEADAEARSVIEEAEAAAAAVRAGVGEIEPAFVEAALALMLPSATRETTCSSG